MYLLCPRSPSHFHPTTVELLKKGDGNSNRYSTTSFAFDYFWRGNNIPSLDNKNPHLFWLVMNKSFLFLLISSEHNINPLISAWYWREFVPDNFFYLLTSSCRHINVNFECFIRFIHFFRLSVRLWPVICFLIHFFFIIFHYFSKKDSHQRQNELLEGISPALLELIEKIAEELLFDKGGCQLVLAALLQCAGGFSW